MSDAILVLNSGSSSIKFQLFSIEEAGNFQRRFKGQIEGVGVRPRLLAKNDAVITAADESWSASDVPGIPQALDKVVAFLRAEIGGQLPVAVGHRVVHGGPDFAAPTLIDDGVLEKLDRLSPLAPLHQPNNLAPIRVVRQRHPSLPQIACFDTAFHRTHSEIADLYALPEQFYAEGVRRYGFHGLSYEYIAGRLQEIDPKLAEGRIGVAHLGSGASMCAVVNGKSIESTMGFTALDGLPMGTRPGQTDPGIVLYLLREKGMSAEEIERLFYHECGLKGISGIGNDVRDLVESALSNPRARLALDYFVYRIALFAGMLAAAMEGIDGFVFTAGIGENAPLIRQAVAEKLSWLGLKIDPRANAANAPKLSTAESRVACYVIPTDEERMIAEHTLRVLGVTKPLEASAP
jgi:acetate kinase